MAERHGKLKFVDAFLWEARVWVFGFISTF